MLCIYCERYQNSVVAGSLTPGRRRSSGAGNFREQLATSHGSVFYSSSRSTSSFVNLAMSAVFSTYPSPLQSPRKETQRIFFACDLQCFLKS